jgi:hypothetical protein
VFGRPWRSPRGEAGFGELAFDQPKPAPHHIDLEAAIGVRFAAVRATEAIVIGRALENLGESGGFVAVLDAWITKQDDALSRPEAIRRLLVKALGKPKWARGLRGGESPPLPELTRHPSWLGIVCWHHRQRLVGRRWLRDRLRSRLKKERERPCHPHSQDLERSDLKRLRR